MLCSTASGNASRAKVLLALSVLTLLGKSRAGLVAGVLREALEDVKGDLPLPASLQLLVQDDGGVLWLELWLRAHGGDGLDRQDGGHNNGKLAKHVHLCGT